MTILLFGHLFLSTVAYTAAAFGLAGSLTGGAIAGTVSLRVARKPREAAETTWIRDNRRQTYDLFLTSAQRFMLACRSETKDALAVAGIEFWGSTA